MSCGESPTKVVCSQRSRGERLLNPGGATEMKQRDRLTRFSVIVMLILQLCVAAFTQEEKREQDLGASTPSSLTGQTGAEARSTRMAAAKPGKADGMGNPQLGGERRPLYRLNRSDVVALSFTLSPEFDQLLTVQPDGYTFLQDAGPVLAQGRTLEEFRLAVRRAYEGYL